MISIKVMIMMVIMMGGKTFVVTLPNEKMLASQNEDSQFVPSLKEIEDIDIFADYRKMRDEYAVEQKDKRNTCVKTEGGSASGACCVFPFVYKSKQYNECTKKGHNRLWCRTGNKWGNCLTGNRTTDVVLGPDLGKTSWGKWTSWSTCPPQEKVTGFRLRVESPRWWRRDETALNGIEFSCEGGTTTGKIEYPRGGWTSWKKCAGVAGKGYVVEFDVKGMTNRGKLGDDYGATNVRMKCSGGDVWVGAGLSKGSWVGYRGCPVRTFMCGGRAEIEEKKKFLVDDTALNRIQMGCCREDILANCGKQNSATPYRIVGGINAKKYEWPWQVGFWIPTRKYPFCGGTLISSNVVLTAAHCFDVGRDKSRDSVRVGDYSMKTTGRQEEVVGVKRIIRHEKWNNATYQNDIALIILAKHVKLEKAVNIACLPRSADISGACFATGWGNLRQNGPQPNVLQEVELPIVSRARCKASYGRDLYDDMMCAGHAEGGADSCQGDSGGPLVCRKDIRTYEIRGVVSWGYGCAQPGYYGIYANVFHFVDWIEQNMPLD